MWVRDDYEREVPRLMLLVLLQPSLHENIVEIRSIMQLIPYPALVNQPDSASDDQAREPQADHYRLLSVYSVMFACVLINPRSKSRATLAWMFDDVP